MPSKILCALIEDYPQWQEKIEKTLLDANMRVVAKAATRASALALIPKLPSLGVSVIILDGCLDQGNEDGNIVGKYCHEIAPHIIRVGMSRYLEGVTECDLVVGKENLADLPLCIREVLDIISPYA